MITCPKCNKELSDDTKFCDDCGASVTEIPDEEMPTAAPVEEVTMAAPDEEMPVEAPAAQIPAEAPAEKKQLPKKAILFGGIGVAVIAVLILLVSLLSGGKSGNYALYLKDEEIFFNDLKKDSEAWQLTSRLVDTDEIGDEELAEAGYVLGLFTYMSKDGEYIFYVDKISDDDDGLNLYYKKVAKPDMEAVKVDSGVQSYVVNDSSTLITYTKGDDGNLYQYQIGKDSKDKIASEVTSFEVSDDGKRIIYRNSEGSIYLKNGEEDKEKIASEISSLEYITEDLKTVYYVKDETLYKHVIGADKESIASDIYDVLRIYSSGEVYYLKDDSKEISLMDYVNDDMKDADAAITEPAYPAYPESPDYPYWWEYDTDEEYNAAYDAYVTAYEAWETEYERMEEEYYAAYEVYYAKLYRDELRADLEEATMDYTSYSLCFYNGKEDVVVTDAFIGDYYYSDYTLAGDAPVIAYKAYSQSGVDKVKLTEIDSIYDVEYLVEDAMFSKSDRYIAVKGTSTVVEQEKAATSFIINASGSVVYYIDDIPDEKNYGDLYRISIEKGVPGKAELYDSDVYYGNCYLANGTDLVYFKDYKEGKGELYINKNKIDYDVQAYNFQLGAGENQVFYFTDWNGEKEYGTLEFYDGKESVKISDDAHSFTLTPDGRVLYLYDYSMKSYKGELHEWSDGETRKIDDDVVSVLPILDLEFRGYNYYW